MAELLKPTDTLAQGYPKINVAIEQAEQAFTTADNAMDTANSSIAVSNQALANSQSTQEQLNQIVIDGDSSVEAAQARVNADNTITYDTLKERLDAEHQEVSSQLADKANKTEVVKKVNGTLPDVNGNVAIEIPTPDLTNYATKSELSFKADKTQVFTMANMGQDIKEAMTGGSVAVVGVGAVALENLNLDLKGFTEGRNAEFYFDTIGTLKILERNYQNEVYFRFDNYMGIKNFRISSMLSNFTSLSSVLTTKTISNVNYLVLANGKSICFNAKNYTFDLVDNTAIQPFHLVLFRNTAGILNGLAKDLYNGYQSYINNQKDDTTVKFTGLKCVEKQTLNTIYWKSDIVVYIPLRGGFSYNRTIAQLKTMFPDKVVGDYLKLDNWYALVYNYYTSVIEIVYYNAIDFNHLVLMINIDGTLGDCVARGQSLRVDLDSVIANGVGADITYLTNSYNVKNLSVISKQNFNSASFVFMTDGHYTQAVGNQLNAVKSIKKITDELDIKAIVVGGDNANDTLSSKDSILSKHRDYMNEFYKLGKTVLPMVGNHDDATWFQTTYNTQGLTDVTGFALLPNDINNAMGKRADGYIVRDWNNPQGNYYYYDVPESKIRVLCLNTSDYPYIKQTVDGFTSYKYAGTIGAISNAQINFFAMSLENIPSEYSILVFSHMPLQQSASIKGSERDLKNDNIMFNVLKAFKNGTSYTGNNTEADFECNVTVDFTSPHDIIGMFAGHTHYDNLTQIDGINFITTLNASCDQWSDSPARVQGTETETAFDVITVDTENRTVYLTRYGAGSDREFTY